MNDSTAHVIPAQVDFFVIPQPADEEWKPVVGYETEYAVSSLGRIKRLKESTARRRYPAGMILKPTKLKNGYMTFVFKGNGTKKRLYIHRVVMAAFIGEVPYKHEVNHINSIRDDNRLANLEYVTRSGNNLHAYRTNNRKAHPTYGQKHHCWKITDEQVVEIREAHSRGQSYASLARKYGCEWTSIRSIVQRKTHKYVA